MGSGIWDTGAWKSYSTKLDYASKSVKEIYSSRKLDQMLDPKGVKVRESRDSKDNPESTAIIIGLDVTGSMHSVLDQMARHGLNTLCSSLYERRPVSDPHIMCMGIGDVEVDQAPLQVSQFEADIRIATQLEKMWLEGGGGGNHYESYTLPWYFAAEHTSIDCFEKRNKKGYIFTVGDEEPNANMLGSELKRVLGYAPEGDLSAKALLKKVSKKYNVFHLMVEEGDYYRRRPEQTKKAWEDLLGQRAIVLHDHRKMGQVIVSTIEVHEGKDIKEVANGWDKETAAVISKSLGGYNRKLDLDF